MSFSKQILVSLLALALLPALSGCTSLNRIFRSDEDSLPGRRIPLEVNSADSPSPASRRVQLDPPNSGANWTQTSGGATNFAPHLPADAALTQLWSVDIGRGTGRDSTIVAQPLVIQGVVFTLDSQTTLRAKALSSGGTLWERRLAPRSERSGYFGGGIAYEAGVLYASTGFAELIAVRARDGAELWRRALPGIAHGAPTVADGRIFVSTVQNKSRAFNSNGQLLWDHEGQPQQTGILGTSSPAVAGDRVVIGYSSGEVFALNAATGEEVWSDTLAVSATGSLTAEIGDIRAQPVIAGSTVYVVSNAGRTAAFDLGRGALLWETAFGGSQTPVVSGNALFLVTGDARAVALDRSNGGLIWQTQLQKDRERFLQSPFPLAWKGPVLIGNRLMYGSSRGQVVSLNPLTGAEIGKLSVGGPVAVAPSGGNGVALFLTDRARLIALR